MDRVRWIAVGWIAIACFTAACAKKSVSDQSLAAAVQSKLSADDTTKSVNIKVDAKDGVVTLSGDVPSSDVELAALKDANGTPGVSKVDDQLKVSAAAAPVPPPASAPAATAPASTASSTPAPAAAPAPVAAAPPPAAAPVAEATAPATAPAVAADTPPPAPKVRTLTVPAGTRLQVRMIDGVDSSKNTVGQTFNATLDSPLVSGNHVVVQAGAPVTVALTAAQKAGHVKGSNELQVQAIGLTSGGRTYELATDVVEQAGKAKGKQTAVRTGIGAAAGALIGGLAGGGKGAAIGAGAGGGAGFGYQFFTHGSKVKIPSESVLTFRLAAPLTVRR
ncbi:MAG TPA: BON domain-containing protein [Bryobacteraceae bacterium]|jgi:hypothetical protein